ncbi:hypothetical protein FB451DRAFT_1182925 [Mycena latifolia]|nr:hypothetical protein FB451DRAFT_1182925 [Mycena latifolia]
MHLPGTSLRAILNLALLAALLTPSVSAWDYPCARLDRTCNAPYRCCEGLVCDPFPDDPFHGVSLPFFLHPLLSRADAAVDTDVLVTVGLSHQRVSVIHLSALAGLPSSCALCLSRPRPAALDQLLFLHPMHYTEPGADFTLQRIRRLEEEGQSFTDD